VKLIVEADGGSRGNPGVAGFGAVVREAGTGRVLAERAAYLGDAVTNNVAEYSGLIAGLRAAGEVDPAAAVEVRMDSKLVVSQMSGVWKIKNPQLAKLAAEARRLIGRRTVVFKWVPRASNQAADALANQVMDSRGAIANGEDSPLAAAAGSPAGSAGVAAVGSPVAAAPGSPAGSAGGPVAARRPDRPGNPRALDDAVRLAQAVSSGAQRHPGTPGPITTVILIRHGMSVDTDRDVFAGGAVPGPPLSEAGALQAVAAADELTRMLEAPWFALERPSVLVSSPTRRAMQTAEPVARALGLTVHIDSGFVEEDFGLWDGLTKDRVEARWPGGVEAWAADADYEPGGGESRRQVGVRVQAALARVARANLGKTIVIASHAMVTRAAIGAALGASAQAWFGIRIAPGSISALRLWPQGLTEVVCTNRTAAR
jgi:probable phosphoglycerate mutase